MKFLQVDTLGRCLALSLSLHVILGFYLLGSSVKPEKIEIVILDKLDMARPMKGRAHRVKPEDRGGLGKDIDRIERLDPGLEESLSTKETVYYTYFERIKEKMQPYWTDNLRAMFRHEEQGLHRGPRVRYDIPRVSAACLITLDKDGNLIRIQFIGESEDPRFDETAVKTIKDTVPFPNPPKGMQDPDGLIRVRIRFYTTSLFDNIHTNCT